MPRGFCPIFKVAVTWSVAVSMTETVDDPSFATYATGAAAQDPTAPQRRKAAIASVRTESRIAYLCGEGDGAAILAAADDFSKGKVTCRGDKAANGPKYTIVLDE